MVMMQLKLLRFFKPIVSTVYYYFVLSSFHCSSGIFEYVSILMRIQCRIGAQPRCLVGSLLNPRTFERLNRPTFYYKIPSRYHCVLSIILRHQIKRKASQKNQMVDFEAWNRIQSQRRCKPSASAAHESLAISNLTWRSINQCPIVIWNHQLLCSHHSFFSKFPYTWAVAIDFPHITNNYSMVVLWTYKRKYVAALPKCRLRCGWWN
jgi:hypothetical protein